MKHFDLEKKKLSIVISSTKLNSQEAFSRQNAEFFFQSIEVPTSRDKLNTLFYWSMVHLADLALRV